MREPVIVQVIVHPPASSYETCRREEEQTGLYPNRLCLAHTHASQVSTHLDISPHLRLAEKNNNHDAADKIKGKLRSQDFKGHKRAKEQHPKHLRIVSIVKENVGTENYIHNIQDHA